MKKKESGTLKTKEVKISKNASQVTMVFGKEKKSKK